MFSGSYNITLLTIITGIICGILLCAGNQLSAKHQLPNINRLFSLMRWAIFILFSYTVLQFHTTNSILLIVLFLVSYLGTVLLSIYKTG